MLQVLDLVVTVSYEGGRTLGFDIDGDLHRIDPLDRSKRFSAVERELHSIQSIATTSSRLT